MVVKYTGNLSQGTIKTMKEKHGIDMKPVDEIGRKPSAVVEGTTEISKDAKVTRASLMENAKALGIKYFRILSKAELEEVLIATPERVKEITTIAINRWKKVI